MATFFSLLCQDNPTKESKEIKLRENREKYFLVIFFFSDVFLSRFALSDDVVLEMVKDEELFKLKKKNLKSEAEFLAGILFILIIFCGLRLN